MKSRSKAAAGLGPVCQDDHAPVKVCAFEDIYQLITDHTPPADLARRLAAVGTRVLIAD